MIPTDMFERCMARQQGVGEYVGIFGSLTDADVEWLKDRLNQQEKLAEEPMGWELAHGV